MSIAPPIIEGSSISRFPWRVIPDWRPSPLIIVGVPPQISCLFIRNRPCRVHVGILMIRLTSIIIGITVGFMLWSYTAPSNIVSAVKWRSMDIHVGLIIWHGGGK